MFDFSADSSVSSDIQAAVEAAVESWANLRFQAVYRTVHGLLNIWKAYEFLVKNVYFPDKAGDQEFVTAQVAKKLQLVLAYQNFGKISADDLRREDIEAMQSLYKCFDVVYLDEKKNVLQVVKGAYSAPAEHGIHPQYKPMNQNNFGTWLTNDKVLLFDANCDMRFEDALKLPNLLMEFNQDKLLKGINLPEYIFTEDFNWIGQAHGFGDRTWTTFVQRFLAMYGADGFYGHGAVFDRDVIQEFGVLSPDYVSEDLMMTMKIWLKGKGYRIEHKEYLQCGKAREVSVPASAIPFNKFAEGSAELFVGRQLKRLFASQEVAWYQKMFLFFTLGFYLRKPLVVLTMLAYISLVMVLGVSGFAGFPLLMTFGLLGILFSQVISFTGFGQIMLERGILNGAVKFGLLFPKLLLIFPYYVMVYCKGLLGGFNGKAAFIVTKKSWEIEKSNFQEKIASFYDTKTKIVAVFLVAAAVSCFLWQALPVIYSLLFMWMVFSWLFTPVITAPGVLPTTTGFGPAQYKRWAGLVLSYLKNEVYGMKFFKVYDTAIAAIALVAIVGFGFPLTFALFLLPVSAFGLWIS